MENVIIAGSGPAGATAGIYTARAGLEPLIITGMQRGGQLTTTTEVENYPGFPEGIMGHELTENMLKQAERFGARLELKEITGVSSEDDVITVNMGEDILETRVLIIATGSSPRKLGLKQEEKLAARGVSYCATCDGFFFKDKIIGVVGGGDSALEEAQFLSRFGSTVYIIHRRGEFRGSKAMQDKALAKENIQPLYNSVVSDIVGEEKVEAVILENTESGEKTKQKMDGLFVAIGHIPNSRPFSEVTEFDDSGYIVTDQRMHTKTPGVFACGDVVDHYFMQAVTAAGMGCKAGIEAEKYLADIEGKSYPSR